MKCSDLYSGLYRVEKMKAESAKKGTGLFSHCGINMDGKNRLSTFVCNDMTLLSDIMLKNKLLAIISEHIEREQNASLYKTTTVKRSAPLSNDCY